MRILSFGGVRFEEKSGPTNSVLSGVFGSKQHILLVFFFPDACSDLADICFFSYAIIIQFIFKNSARFFPASRSKCHRIGGDFVIILQQYFLLPTVNVVYFFDQKLFFDLP